MCCAKANLLAFCWFFQYLTWCKRHNHNREYDMDLGIKGKRALVCASSKGLGLGCAEALAAAGVDLVMNARGSEALEAAAQAIRDAHGVEVVTVAGPRLPCPHGRLAPHQR